jgi:DNA-binding NarL/FixJ family response regulator
VKAAAALEAGAAAASATAMPERVLGVLHADTPVPEAWSSPAGDGLRLLDWCRDPVPSDLHECLSRRPPTLMLVDLAWIESRPPEEIDALRRRHIATDWIVAWSGALPTRVEPIIRCHAIGGLDWQAARATFERAVDAVLRGEYWFARAVMQLLYVTLLEGGTTGPGAAQGAPGVLSQRESQALDLMREGLTNKEIAQRLGISVNTVKKHLAHAFVKAGLRSRRQLFG